MANIVIRSQRDLTRIRRIALAAQGLLQAQPFGLGLKGAKKAIEHTGYVQIDTISVVERAHNHVIRSRVPNFNPSMTNQLLLNSDIFEYWTHAAAFIPIDDFRFSLPYKHAIKNGQTHWYKHPDRKLMKELLARIRSEGSIRSRDLESNRTKGSGWWDLKPAKQALEQLFIEGDLMVSNREGFQKSYDLSERVLPSHINTQLPTINEYAAHLLDQQLRCHGIVSLKGVTYLRKNPELREAVKSLVEVRLAEGQLDQITLPNGDVFFIRQGEFERPLPRLNKRLSILSPFDNSLIQRDRLKALFQFDYQIECYVPEAKRQYGYFSLPLLFGDSFIGRMDCKAHRKEGHLEIKSLHFEKTNIDIDLLISAFKPAIQKFCEFQQCRSVSLTKVNPEHLIHELKPVLELQQS